MRKLRYAEFYITNVCNLNCQNCNRFNNYAFSGHQRWNDHAEAYQQWSQILDFNVIGIIGGEPLLNPDFPAWLENIATLWPNSKILIVTNGTQIDRWPNLYQQVKKYRDRVVVEISLHGFDLRNEILGNVMSWLQGPVSKEQVNIKTAHDLWKKAYTAIKDPSWPDCDSPEQFHLLPEHIQRECKTQHNLRENIWNEAVYATLYTDSNGVQVQIKMANYFNESSVIFNDGELRLQNSDPKKALAVCYSKHCHHFIKGKLYKCGPVGLFSEFVSQFPVKVTQSDLELINAYEPAVAEWPLDQVNQFVDDLVNEKIIPQCKFCPEKMEPVKFESGYKKIKIVKQKTII